MGWVKRSLWGLGGVLAVTVVTLASWEPYLSQQPGPPPPPRQYQAEVIRDEWGVPHILGKSDADVAFGTAWAHAEDDFSTLQDVVAMTRGRYGAIAGREGAGVDFAYHFVDARGAADRGYDRLPADVRAVLEAYASGLNRYAAVHPSEIKLARLFPVNGKDIATGFALRLPFFFGLDRVLRPLTEATEFSREHGPRLDGKPAPLFADGRNCGERRIECLCHCPAALRRWRNAAFFKQSPAVARRSCLVRAANFERTRLEFCRGNLSRITLPLHGPQR